MGTRLASRHVDTRRLDEKRLRSALLEREVTEFNREGSPSPTAVDGRLCRMVN
jgi:hypothetical protein